MNSISISEIETLRAMVFTEYWSLSDIAYKKAMYDPNETCLEALCGNIEHLEENGYLIAYELDYDLFSNHCIRVAYDYEMCEQLLGITRAMFFECGVCYENIACAKYSVQCYDLPFRFDEFNGMDVAYFPSSAQSGWYIKRDNEWLYMKELQTTETIDMAYGVSTDSPRVTGIAREATQDEIREVKANGVRLW